MLSKKDIEKNIKKYDLYKGEEKPVIVKNGKRYIPTNKGYIIKSVKR